MDVTEGGHGPKEDKRKDKDRERKHRKRHHGAADDVSSDKEEKEDAKKSRRHSGDHKKSRKVRIQLGELVLKGVRRGIRYSSYFTASLSDLRCSSFPCSTAWLHHRFR